MIYKRSALWPLAALWPVVAFCAESGTSHAVTLYAGMCDASAAVALDANTLIVADDEVNTLRIYRPDRPGPPVMALLWDRPLGIRAEDEHPEVDIEGAAMLEDRIYWISSHGRNRKGKWRPNRHRFFAISVTRTPNGTLLEPFGKPSRTLIEKLVDDEKLREFGLAEALGAGVEKSQALAPKSAGLNIEGLCATADGKSLLIGFRNPRPHNKALLVPLDNPAAVLTDGADPQVGVPIQLELEVQSDQDAIGLGIRSIEYSVRHRAYLIIAGPYDNRDVFGLYRWSGSSSDSPKLLAGSTMAINQIEHFSPEALIVYPDKDRIQLLSDDGSVKVRVGSPAECREGEYDNGKCEAKHLLDDGRKTFRGVWVGVK